MVANIGNQTLALFSLRLLTNKKRQEVLGIDSNHSCQPSFFSKTDRCFPWGSRMVSGKIRIPELRMELEVSPREVVFAAD